MTVSLSPKISFIAVRASRALLSFASLYLVQSYLINAYNPSVNASVQVALKLIGIQGLFTTGFALIILSHPLDHKQFLKESANTFWLSFIARFVGLLLIALLFPITLFPYLDSGLGCLYWPLIAFLLFGLLGGEGQALAYTSRKAFAYESKILVAQVIALLLLGLAFYASLTPWVISIIALVAFVSPKYLVDVLYSIKGIPAFPRRLAIPSSSSSKKLLIKSISSSALSATAFFNWSIDVVILASLGTAAAVNKLSVFTLVFSVPAIIAGFATPMLQLRWSNPSNSVKPGKDISLLSSGCAIAIFLVAFLYLTGSRALPLLFPVYIDAGSSTLYIAVAISSFLSCLSSFIGVLLNSRLKIGRQVLIIGLVITPMNIFLSFRLFPSMGATGIVLATILAQIVTITLNLMMLRKDPKPIHLRASP